MYCYYHEKANVSGQCPLCSKFLCKACLDEYGTGFCKECTTKKYRKFCEDFKEKLAVRMKSQREKVQLVEGVIKKIKVRAVIRLLFFSPFYFLWILFFTVYILYNLVNENISFWTIPFWFVLELALIILPVYIIIAGEVARGGAQLHRELKEKERTENITKDFSPEMRAIFTELRLVATSVSPFGRDQIYEEPGESDVWFFRLKRRFVVQNAGLFSAPIIWKKIKEAQQKLKDEYEQLKKVEVPSFGKFVSVQRTLLINEEYKPDLPEFKSVTDPHKSSSYKKK